MYTESWESRYLHDKVIRDLAYKIVGREPPKDEPYGRITWEQPIKAILEKPGFRKQLAKTKHSAIIYENCCCYHKQKET